MKLTELLDGIVEVTERETLMFSALEITGLAMDSRTVKSGDLFIAVSGAKQHGLAHIDQVTAKGAKAVLYDPAGEGNKYAQKSQSIPFIPVVQLNNILGELASRFYRHPSEHLAIIGITGTNGKTSCSQFLGQTLDNSGIIGTLGWGTWGALNKTINTTPDALTIQQILAEFVAENKKAVAMEVSSHGLDQGRVQGITFKGAVYTNISRDHLDYHGSMEDYLSAKLKLLQMQGLSFAVVNADDENAELIFDAVPKGVKVWGVSTKAKTRETDESVVAEDIEHTGTGIEFTVCWNGNTQRMVAPIFGNFNVENLLCVIAVMLAMGHTLQGIASKLKTLQPVTGRMQRCGTVADDISVFVDYAHTPDALYRVLTSLRKHCTKSLWVVFGCGGDRDIGKRPQMGSLAEQWADFIIVTDDNPRSEDNQEITRQILSGCNFNKAILIQDRKEAIQFAIANASKSDCIVIAGKGHESYQEIRGVQYPFNDRQIAEEAIRARCGTQ
jgi:UDP-N-acetylmuramoyl-L-alanyl-D-glutamate--2,6-diaminopimelate ligase